MVKSQISGKFLGQGLRESPWLCTEKNSRVSHSKVKVGLLTEIHIPQIECDPSQKVRMVLNYGVVSFYGLANFLG